MGMSSIMGAEKIYLIAVGKHKKEILEVYFAKAGSSWCHPRSLKLLSRS